MMVISWILEGNQDHLSKCIHESVHDMDLDEILQSKEIQDLNTLHQNVKQDNQTDHDSMNDHENQKDMKQLLMGKLMISSKEKEVKIL